MTKRKVALERRHFLQLVGASALTYPFLRGVPSYAAASGTPPTYLVLIFTPCGCVRPLWGATDVSGKDVARPPACGERADADHQLQVPRHAGALRHGRHGRRHQLDDQPAEQGDRPRRHQQQGRPGIARGRDGVALDRADLQRESATSISIDQQIAGMLKAGTPFPTIQLMVRDPADFTAREVKTRMIYNAAGVFVDPIDNPTAAASTCFPTMTARPRAGQDDLHPAAAVRQRRAPGSSTASSTR